MNVVAKLQAAMVDLLQAEGVALPKETHVDANKQIAIVENPSGN